MKNLVLFLMVLAVIFLGACTPTAPVDISQVSQKNQNLQVYPESDNGNTWSANSYVSVDITGYKLSVEILGDMKNHSEINGESYGSMYVSGGFGYGYSSSRMWQDGKGILPVRVLSISPEVSWVDQTKPVILKTTDLKVMGVPAGAIVTVICNHDVEVLSPVKDGQILTTDHLTDELDDCRMMTPNYLP